MPGQQSGGIEAVGSSKTACTYSYSSTGSAFGWAIGEATATDPPPYVFDCRARMSTVSITPGADKRLLEGVCSGVLVASIGGRVAATWTRTEQVAGARLDFFPWTRQW